MIEREISTALEIARETKVVLVVFPAFSLRCMSLYGIILGVCDKCIADRC